MQLLHLLTLRIRRKRTLSAMALLLSSSRPSFTAPWTASARPPKRSSQAPNRSPTKKKPSGGTERHSKSRRSFKRSRLATISRPEDYITSKWTRVQPTNMLKPAPRPSDLRPESCPALVLNADFSPLSYMPLSLWPWQDVIKAVFLDRVTVVATYDIGVRSPGMIFPLPSVISLKQYQPMAVKRPAFTRFNVFMRDSFSCQYCGHRFPTQELTFDHVVPRCLNGKTNWENVVTACISCNHRKGRSLLSELKNMRLRRMPAEPSNAQLQSIARDFPPRYLHESWRDYIYWSQTMQVEDDQ